MGFFDRAQTVGRERLGTEPVNRLLLSMAAPSVIAMLMQSVYSIINSSFVAAKGEAAFNAVLLADPVTMIIGALSTGIGVGINSSISRCLGSANPEGASRAAGNGLVLGFVTTAVFILFGLIGPRPYMRIFTEDREVIGYGVDYIRTISLLAFGSIFTQVSFSIMQGSGSMAVPMVSQLVGGACAVGLNPLFIYVFDLKVLGTALATACSQIVSMCIGLYCVFRINRRNLPIAKRDFRLSGHVVRDILAVGVPSALTQATTSVVSGIIYKMISANGTAAVAAYGGYTRYSGFGTLTVFGITRGMNPILGYSYGAGDKKRFLDTERLAALWASAVTVVTALLFILGPGLILRMISATPETARIGETAYPILGIPMIITGASIVLVQAFPPAKRSYLTMIHTLLRQVALLVPLCTLLSRSRGLEGVWYGYAATDLIAFWIAIVMTIRFKQTVLDKLQPPANQPNA